MRATRLTLAALTAAALAATLLGVVAPARAATDSVWAWGIGSGGQIGNGVKSSVNVPTRVILPAGVTFSKVYAGGSECGLSPAGKAYCWGSDSFGLLGDGGPSDWSMTTTATIDPAGVTMPSGVTFTSLTAARLTWCALGANGKAYCWGRGEDGEIGNGTAVNTSVPTEVTMPEGDVTFTQITANRQTFCALSTAGDVYCWGTGWPGTIGNGSTANATVPTRVTMPGGVTIARLSAVFYATCGLSTTGKAYCWGSNSSGTGILGNGTDDSSATPVAVTMPVPAFTSLVPRLESSTMCAFAPGGAAYCWGDGSNGQIGNGTTASVNVPTLVTLPEGVTLASITQYTGGMCGLSTAGAAYCWGYNGQGQMGVASASPLKVGTPVAVNMPAATTFTSLTAAGRQMCALTGTGAAYCWGEGLDGEMGNGQWLDQYEPVAVTMPGVAFSSMTSSWDLFLALSEPLVALPGVPGAPVATAGSGRATVRVTAGTGGAPASYRVTAAPGGRGCTVTAPAVSCVVTGLVNGTSYRFRATATNSAGTSAASALSNAVVPRATQVPVGGCVTVGSTSTIPRSGWKTLMLAGCATTAGRRVAAKVTATTIAGAKRAVTVVCVVSGARVAPVLVGSGYVRCARGVLKIAPTNAARRITVRWYAAGSTTVRAYTLTRNYTT